MTNRDRSILKGALAGLLEGGNYSPDAAHGGLLRARADYLAHNHATFFSGGTGHLATGVPYGTIDAGLKELVTRSPRPCRPQHGQPLAAG